MAAIGSPQEIKFRHVFMMSFRTFATVDEVFSLLLKRYDMPHPLNMSTRELSHWVEIYLEPKQRRILNIIKTWIEEHGLIQDDPQISLKIMPFLASIVSPPALASEAASLLISVQRPVCASLRSYVMQFLSLNTAFVLKGNTLPLVIKRKKSKGLIKPEEFFKMDPTLVAKQICLLDHGHYANIRPHECFSWPRPRPNHTVAHLSTFVGMYNKIAAWIKHTILNIDTPVKRAHIIDFWIEVAQVRISHSFTQDLPQQVIFRRASRCEIFQPQMLS